VASRDDRKIEAIEMKTFCGEGGGGAERDSSCSEVHKYRKEIIRNKIKFKKNSL
jgi:hypothetical protein